MKKLILLETLSKKKTKQNTKIQMPFVFLLTHTVFCHTYTLNTHRLQACLWCVLLSGIKCQMRYFTIVNCNYLNAQCILGRTA